MHYESIQKNLSFLLEHQNQKYFYIHKLALPVTAVKCIFFCKHKYTYIKTMSLQAFSPASSASIIEEISTRMMSNVIKDFNIEELIEYLKKKNLKLEESHFKILRKEEIAGSDFLNTTKEEFQSYGMKAGLAKRLAEFIESLGQKLRNYSSLKTLDDLKEMLRRNKVNGKDITSIKQFTSSE